MADPFSVAGTAVGITSLGIQTCQILYNYYSKYKGYHDDIDSVLQQVEGLKGILESLRCAKERFEIDDDAPSSPLHVTLKACEDALARLKMIADKCNTTKQAEGIQSRFRDVKKRLLWPCKKETLADMQATLSRFQGNLSLALQCAGFDGIARKLEDQLPRLDAMSHQTTNMEQSLISHKRDLEVIQRGVADVSLVQHRHDIALSREMMELRDHISACTTMVGSKIELVARSVSSLHNPALVAPSILSDAIQTLETVQPHVQSSLESYDHHSLEIERASADDSLLQMCRCRTKKKQSIQRRYWMPIFSVETYQHDPGCALFASSDYARSVAAQFVVYNKFLGACIQVGWQSSREKGCSTIAPMLRYSAVVSQNTGAFKIFNEGCTDIWTSISKITDLSVRGEEARKVLRRTTEKLQVSLGRNLSPFDVNEKGDGVLHAALKFMHSLLLYSDSESEVWHETQSLLDICLTRSVPLDQINASGFTPIVGWQYNMSMQPLGTNAYETLRHLARRSGDWSLFVPRFSANYHKENLYDSWSKLLRSEELASTLNEDDHLYLAIIRRSKFDLRKFITTHGSEEVAQRLEQVKYLRAMVVWPGGVEILVKESLANDVGGLATMLFRIALEMVAIKSIVALIPLKLQVKKKDWGLANSCSLWKEWKGIERTQWAEVFDTLACLLSPRHDTFARLPDYGSSDTGNSEANLYHGELSVLGAESLWKFGHRGLNSMGCIFDHGKCDTVRHYGTPLWSAAYWNHLYRWKEQLSVFRLLLEHGARAHWIHPVFLTTPVHVFVQNLVRFAPLYGGELTEILEKTSDLLLLERPDDCDCYCSREGCHVIGCVPSERSCESAIYKSDRIRLRKKCHGKTQPYVFHLVQKNRNAAWLSSAILRLMTFEDLSLTHTCCYRVHEEIDDRFQRPTSEEAQVIYDLERDDIELLEKLTTEFEREWSRYTKSFLTFMNRVWKPRMRAVRAERRVDKDIYEAELQRIGVTLKQTDEEEAVNVSLQYGRDYESDFDSDADWPDDYESEQDGWYTTDEEDGEMVEESENSDEEASQLSHDETGDGS